MKPMAMVVWTAYLLLLAGCVSCASDLDWPMFRRDTCLTARSPAKGSIVNPVVRGKVFAGAYEGLAIARPDSAGASLALDPSQTLAPDYWAQHANEWSTEGAFAECTQGGFSSNRGGDIRLIPDLDCRQRVEFEDAFTVSDAQRGYLYACDQPDGKERIIWQTEPEKDMYAPTVIVVDADADGVPEIVVATHYRVMVFNSRTGEKKMELRWHGMRNYGFFGAFTLPGEKYPKFVVIADFASHIDVLDNDGKQLSVLWRRDIESSIMRKDKVIWPGPNPIADLDGDGRPEITFSLFNDKGDHQWHVTSFDPVNGSVLYDIPKAYTHGIADTDGDGTPELFVQDTRGLPTTRFGPVSLVSYRNGEPKVLWSHKRAAWQTARLSQSPPATNTISAGGKTTVMLSGAAKSRTLYAVSETKDGRESLMAISQGAKGKWAARCVITGPTGARLSLKAVKSNSPDILIGWRSNGGGRQKFDTKSASLQAVSWHSTPGPIPAPIVVDGNLITQDGAEHIAAYRKIGSDWKLRWRVPGRGMTGDGIGYYGLVSADVDGDGAVELLYATSSQSGEADLVALGLAGNEKWRHTFAGFDGAPPQRACP